MLNKKRRLRNQHDPGYLSFGQRLWRAFQRVIGMLVLVLVIGSLLTVVAAAAYGLQFSTPEPTPIVVPTPTLELQPNVVVRTNEDLGRVHFRSSPTTLDDNILTIIREGEMVDLLGWTDTGWALVEFEGRTGYIYGDYLAIEMRTLEKDE